VNRHRYVLAALVVCVAAPAFADDTEKACFAAAEAGQRARQLGKLGEAREAFARCARATCPTAVTDDCTRWLAEVDDVMPSVVVVLLDAAGRDLSSGRVFIDGHEQNASDTTRSIALEPGTHQIALEAPATPRVEQTIVLREREKNRQVTLRLPAPPPPPPVHKPSVAPFVIGGVGLFFAASSGAFATAGYLDRHSAHCDVGCAPGDYARVRVELVTADAALGVAAVLVVAAIIDFAVTRSKH
jgi:hypothetical protein